MQCVCLCATDSEVKHNVDIGDGSSVAIVNEFCYLVDMLSGYGLRLMSLCSALSVDGDAEFVVTVRIQSGWLKLRSLACSHAAESDNF